MDKDVYFVSLFLSPNVTNVLLHCHSFTVFSNLLFEGKISASKTFDTGTRITKLIGNNFDFRNFCDINFCESSPVNRFLRHQFLRIVTCETIFTRFIFAILVQIRKNKCRKIFCRKNFCPKGS